MFGDRFTHRSYETLKLIFMCCMCCTLNTLMLRRVDYIVAQFLIVKPTRSLNQTGKFNARITVLIFALKRTMTFRP
jgi:hypothetical protein